MKLSLKFLLALLFVSTTLQASDDAPAGPEDDRCADQLLVLLRESERSAYAGVVLQGRQALQEGDLEALKAHLLQIDEVHSPEIMRHLAQMFPFLLTQFPSETKLISDWIVAMQRHELTFLQWFLNRDTSEAESPDEVFGTLSSMNLIRLGLLADETIGEFTQFILEMDFIPFRGRAYPDHLYQAYMSLRAIHSFSPPPEEQEGGSAVNLSFVLMKDLASEADRALAEFFINIIYLQMELATDELTEDYSPLGPMLAEGLESVSQDTTQAVRAWMIKKGFYFSDADFEAAHGDPDAFMTDPSGEGVLEEGDEDEEGEDGIDYGAMLGMDKIDRLISREGEGEDGELSLVNDLHAELSRIFDISDPDDEPAPGEILDWVDASEYPIEDWLRPYPFLQDEGGMNYYLTPLQMFVIIRDREGIAAVERKLRREALPGLLYLPPSILYQQQWSGGF